MIRLKVIRLKVIRSMVIRSMVIRSMVIRSMILLHSPPPPSTTNSLSYSPHSNIHHKFDQECVSWWKTLFACYSPTYSHMYSSSIYIHIPMFILGMDWIITLCALELELRSFIMRYKLVIHRFNIVLLF